MIADLRVAFESIFGPQHWTPAPWDGGPDFGVDLYVSDADAEQMQRAVDSRLTETWGPQC